MLSPAQGGTGWPGLCGCVAPGPVGRKSEDFESHLGGLFVNGGACSSDGAALSFTSEER